MGITLNGITEKVLEAVISLHFDPSQRDSAQLCLADPVIDLRCESTERCGEGVRDIGLVFSSIAVMALPYWVMSQSSFKIQHFPYIHVGGGTNEVKEAGFVGLIQLNDFGLGAAPSIGATG